MPNFTGCDTFERLASDTDQKSKIGKMTSVEQLILDARDLISCSGRRGLEWETVLAALDLSNKRSIGRIVLISLLKYNSYTCYNGGLQPRTSEYAFTMDALSIPDVVKSTSDDFILLAPNADIVNALGIESCFFSQTDQSLIILEQISASRVRGVLATEIGRLIDTNKGVVRDKLTAAGLLVKRIVVANGQVFIYLFVYLNCDADI